MKKLLPLFLFLFILSYAEDKSRELTLTQTKKQVSEGKYHAIIISENDYISSSIPDLKDPRNDALNLSEILINKYFFNKEDVTLLNDPTRNEIIDALDDKRRQLSTDDNLLIFYAGHGYWDEELEMGYWLPSDARKESIGSWIANTDLTIRINAIQAKHVLLISDACFSGGIFKTRRVLSGSLNRLYGLKSRKAITSGNLTEVPDKSILMKFLIKKLESNKDQFISTDQLFADIRPIIMNNSYTEPLYGVIQMTGDEGGEFIFYNAESNIVNSENNEISEEITIKKKRSMNPVINKENESIDRLMRIAILNFDNTGQVSQYGDIGAPLRDMLITDLQEVKNLKMVDRQSLEKILNEQELNNSENFDSSTATKIGKLLGAEIILTGTYFEFFGNLRIDAKFINVETGEIIFSVGSEGSLTKFFDLKKDLANKIVENLKLIQ
jgi:TolB-like protein